MEWKEFGILIKMERQYIAPFQRYYRNIYKKGKDKMQKIRKGDVAVHVYYGYRAQHVEKNMVEIQQILEASKNGKYPVLVLSKQSLLKQIEDSISALQELKSAIAAIDDRSCYSEKETKENEENQQRTPKENRSPKRKKETLKNKKNPEDALLETAIHEAEEVPVKEEIAAENPTLETSENLTQPQIDEVKIPADQDTVPDDTGITGDLLAELGF